MKMTREYLKRMHAARRNTALRVDRRPIQLGLGGDPWRIIIACALLNRTKGDQVRPVLLQFLSNWPWPQDLLESESDVVRMVLKPLGLQNRRADLLFELAYVWGSDDWDQDWDLPTVGPYAHSALSLFVGLERDVQVDDEVLAGYVYALDTGLGLEEDM